MHLVTVSPLEPREIRRAFPLVQIAFDGVDLARWSGWARRFMGRVPTPDARRGIIMARGHLGTFIGLFIYRTTDDLQHGRTLLIDHLFALDLVDGQHVVALFLDEIDRLADALDCAATQTRLDALNTGDLVGFYRAGHRPESAIVCKSQQASRDVALSLAKDTLAKQPISA